MGKQCPQKTQGFVGQVELRNLTYDCNMIGAFKNGTHPTTDGWLSIILPGLPSGLGSFCTSVCRSGSSLEPDNTNDSK